jgi:hypothetical protein
MKNQNQKAQQIADSGKVGKSSETTWIVASDATPFSYEVQKLEAGFYCQQNQPDGKKICPSWKFCTGPRCDKTCKHVEAVKIFEVKNQ